MISSCSQNNTSTTSDGFNKHIRRSSRNNKSSNLRKSPRLRIIQPNYTEIFQASTSNDISPSKKNRLLLKLINNILKKIYQLIQVQMIQK